MNRKNGEDNYGVSEICIMPERHDSWVEVGEEDSSTGASANSLREAVSKLMIRTAISSHGTAQ